MGQRVREEVSQEAHLVKAVSLEAKIQEKERELELERRRKEEQEQRRKEEIEERLVREEAVSPFPTPTYLSLSSSPHRLLFSPACPN